MRVFLILISILFFFLMFNYTEHKYYPLIKVRVPCVVNFKSQSELKIDCTLTYNNFKLKNIYLTEQIYSKVEVGDTIYIFRDIHQKYNDYFSYIKKYFIFLLVLCFIYANIFFLSKV